MAGPGRIYDLEHKLSVPLGEVDGLTEAFIRRTDGNPARWGLHQTADRLWIQPIPLVDALTREGFGILDAIFESTPLEALKGLTDGLDTQADEIEEGTGEPLVLLRGGLCTNETWAAQMPAFAERFHVVAPERRGHGHTADVPAPLTFADMATDTIGFLDRIVGGPAHLVGWSDGGIVGLLVAIERSDLVRKLVAIWANYNTAGIAPEAEDMAANMATDSDDMAMFRGLYEMHSPDGPEHWPVLFGKFTEMLQRKPHIPVDDLGRISAPTLVVMGDDDLMSVEHSAALFRSIPNSELAVVPGASHAVVIEKPELLNRIVLDFLENEPVPTMMPVRRAATGAEML